MGAWTTLIVIGVIVWIMYDSRIYRIARAIARAEGYYVAGSRPQRSNNPGSLFDPVTGAWRVFETAQEGWQALYRQVRLMLTGRSAHYHPDMTIREVAHIYTGGDKPDAWASIVASSLGVTPDTRLRDV